MKKFRHLIFIDDREADNYYNKYIIDTSELCNSYLFFERAKKAIQYLKKNIPKPDFSTPDIIFLDLVMPEMDCWEFLKEYAKLPRLKSKIIILTTSENPNDLKKIDANTLVHGYVKKPLSEDYLKGWLKKI